MHPHSAEVIPDTHPLPTGLVARAFARALTVRREQGLISRQTDDVRFIAFRGGSYLIFCGVPGHGAAGRWIRLAVSGSVRKPSLAVSPTGKQYRAATSFEEVGSTSLSVTISQTQPHEHQRWEHLPTRLYLAPRHARRRLAGHERQD